MISDNLKYKYFDAGSCIFLAFVTFLIRDISLVENIFDFKKKKIRSVHVFAIGLSHAKGLPRSLVAQNWVPLLDLSLEVIS